jgi:hypothetical protein
MKKKILIALSAASISAYGLPTYEPFTEYATQISAGGSNSIDLATGGYSAPSGEQWGSLNFSGTFGTLLKGWDVLVTNNAATVFTTTWLGANLPSGFPGAGQPVQITAFIPTNSTDGNHVGNSAVLSFAQDITRPTSGTKTIFVSYLMNVVNNGNMGSGNNGRYAVFLASTNLVEGTGTSGAYQTWASLFNQFTAPTPNYVSYGFKTDGSSAYYVGPSDSSGGNNGSVSSLHTTDNTAAFVVAAYVFTTGGTTKDTNILWLNPSTSTFGGLNPPATSVASYTMSTVMSDVGGFCLESRPGSGTSGGIGPTFIGNLLIGSTWSYVTGGPEFTNQPPAYTATALGGTASITGQATAAGQNVTYQWYDLTTGSNAVGSAGSTLTIQNFSSANVGNYVLVAKASGTSYTLPSSTAALVLADPQFTVNPAPATANFNATATFTATANTSNPQLTYGWWHNGVALQNGTLPGGSQTVAVNATGTTVGSSPYTITLTLNSADYLAAGSYYLVVTNSASFLVPTCTIKR